jgi:hypothetical protein
MITIKKIDDTPVFQSGALTLKDALEIAMIDCVDYMTFRMVNLAGADLEGAKLPGADFCYANLSKTNLHKADLRGARLIGADLSCADLTEAELDGAMLEHASFYESCLVNADLTNTQFYKADLFGADLIGATINWDSHELISAILYRRANTVQKRMIAGLVLVSGDWCWENFLRIRHPDRSWALDTLAAYVKPGDNVPETLHRRAKKLKKKEE